MTKEQAKYFVKEIFGEDAANDDDIVDFYFRVNETAMDEYAKQESIAFVKWADENGYTQVAKYRWESLNDFSGKTDEQLYNLYLKQKEEK